MEKIYLNKRFLGLATLLLSSMGILTSCGSYQNNSYYDNDGIYNSNPEPMYTQRVRVGSTQSVDPNYNYNKYENYFAEAKNDYTVFTDTDNFTSEPNTAAYNNDGYVDYTQNQTYAERYGSFGQNSSSVTVNVYSDYGFGYNPYWGWGGYYGSYWGWRRPYVGLYWGSPYYYNNWYGPSWGYYGPNYYGGYYGSGYYGGGYYGGGYYAPYRPAVVRGQGQRTGVVRNNSIAGPNTNNRVGVNRNPSGVNTVGSRPSNTNSGRVTTVRENGVARQAVLRDPSVINRAGVQSGANTVRNNSNNTYNRTTTPQSSNNIRYNTNRGTSNGNYQRTPSSGTINRGSSTPSRSYSPASSPSRGGSMGGGSFGGGARGGSSGGGVRR